jgi:hypothetical protein
MLDKILYEVGSNVIECVKSHSVVCQLKGLRIPALKYF